MQNELHSLMHGADLGAEKEKANSLSVSTSLLQQLHQDNARLRTIVAQLLFKNQMLRWQVSDQQSFPMLAAPAIENERDE
jgi:hypothetical protein